MATHLEFSLDLAQRAGVYLMNAFHLSGTTASMKTDRSFVTEADVAVDKIITQAITEHYPNEAIVSEELHSSLDHPSPAIWIIDPLDGTTNFSLGLHVWGVLITRLKNGHPDTSVLYFPRLNELYTAKRGQGARLNGHQIRIRPPDPKQPYGFFACCSRAYRRYNISVPYKPRILGSAAYSFCMLARGSALISFEATPKIWDIAGAWLLVEEAGGIISLQDGQSPFPLHKNLDFSRKNFPTLGAATPDLHIKSQTQIVPKNPKGRKQ